MAEGVCKKCGQIRELDADDLCADCAAKADDRYWEIEKALEIGKGVRLAGDLRQIEREVLKIEKDLKRKFIIEQRNDGTLLVVRVPKKRRK